MDPERLADTLLERHPDAEPFETDPDQLARWMAEAGADPDDGALTAALLTAWDQRRSA